MSNELLNCEVLLIILGLFKNLLGLMYFVYHVFLYFRGEGGLGAKFGDRIRTARPRLWW